MQLDDLVKRFADAGYSVSPREDVSEHAAAWFLSLSPKTLRNMRSKGAGPSCVLLGRRAWYSIEGLIDYIAEQEHVYEPAKRESSLTSIYLT